MRQSSCGAVTTVYARWYPACSQTTRTAATTSSSSGKRGDRIKVLFWDRGGFVVYYKRLAKGRFRALRSDGKATHIELDGAELAMLLSGFDVRSARRTTAWQPKALRAG